MSGHIMSHWANSSHRGTQLVRRYTKLLRPVLNFIVFVDINPRAIRGTSNRSIIRHR